MEGAVKKRGQERPSGQRRQRQGPSEIVHSGSWAENTSSRYGGNQERLESKTENGMLTSFQVGQVLSRQIQDYLWTIIKYTSINYTPVLLTLWALALSIRIRQKHLGTVCQQFPFQSDKISTICHSKEDRFTQTQSYRGSCPCLTDFKAETGWQKETMEENYSTHGNQEKERGKRKELGTRKLSQVMPQ